MNIAVTGEGVTDYGQQVFGEDKWEEGPVQVYLKRIADNYKINVNIKKDIAMEYIIVMLTEKAE